MLSNSFRCSIQWAVFCVLMLVPCSLVGQPLDVRITSANASPTSDNPHHWLISVGYNQGFDIVGFDNADFSPVSHQDIIESSVRNPAVDPARYHVIDVLSGQRLAVTRVYFDTSVYRLPVSQRARPGSAVLYLDPSIRLQEGRPYHLYIRDVTFEGGKSPKDALQAPITVTASTNSNTPPDHAIELTAADGREDANIYIAGRFGSTGGERLLGSLDVKLANEVPSVIGNRVHYFGGAFELRASEDPAADPDALNLSAHWRWPVWKYGGSSLSVPFRRAIWRNSLALESERDFENSNALWPTRLTLLSRTWSNPVFTAYVRPFAGNELGYNLASPLDEAENRVIERLFVGTIANIVFPLDVLGFRALNVESSYIRRWPLLDEVHFQENEDGGLTPSNLGRAPREHLEVSAILELSRLFGISLTLESGELPPSYKRVDRKISLGFTYKAQIQ